MNKEQNRIGKNITKLNISNAYIKFRLNLIKT